MEPLGLTITKLDEILNVSRKAVSAIENEKKALPRPWLYDFQKHLMPRLICGPICKKYDMWEAENKANGWQNLHKIDMAHSIS